MRRWTNTGQDLTRLHGPGAGTGQPVPPISVAEIPHLRMGSHGPSPLGTRWPDRGGAASGRAPASVSGFGGAELRVQVGAAQNCVAKFRRRLNL